MIRRFMTASAIVLVSAGLAVAQTSGGATGTATGTMETGAFQWNQTSQGAFFTDGAIKSDGEIRAAFDALDTEQQAQLRSDCQRYASASGTGTGATGTTSTGSAMGGSTASTDTTGSATGTVPSGSSDTAATGTDDTQTSSTTSSTTGATGATSGTAGASAMPDMASMEQLCAQVQSY